MNSRRFLSAAGLVIHLSTTVFSQDASTNPVGFIRSQTLPSSDTVVACPLDQTSEFRGKVAAATGSAVTVAGAPAWTAGQFMFTEGSQPKIYYVRFTSGARAGAYYTVLGNTSNTITVDLNGDTLAQVVAGDGLALTPYWTIGSVFPSTAAGVSFESSPTPVARRTEILFPDQAAVGMKPSSAATYFFFNGAWRKVGAPPTTSFNNTAVLLPDSWIIVRNQAFTGSLTFLGSVLSDTVRIGLNSWASANQDNLVGLARAIDVSLDDSGLIASGAFRTSTDPASHTDEILVFDNTTTGINKSAAATYFYYNGGWRKVGQPLGSSFGTELVFKAGQGAVVRKSGNGTGPLTTPWVNVPNF